MTPIGNFKHSFAACLWGAFLAFTVVTSGTAEARQAGNGGNASAITLIAPAQVRDILKDHFDLTDSPLPDETARAAFRRRAQQEISALLASEGYFTPTVTLHSVGPDGVQKLEVVPGPRALVSQINIEFTGNIAAAGNHDGMARIAQARAAWLLGVGAPFRSPDWEAAKSALLSGVAQKDYAAAQITLSQARVDPLNARAELTLVIDSGPAFRFGKLEVSGLERYPEKLVARQAPFHTGDPYSRNLLLTFQAKLQSMPQFSSVVVNIKPDVSTHAAAPVQVVLSEAKSRRVAVGIGYSTNNGARGEINYRNHDFMQRALVLGSGLRLEQNRQTLLAGINTQQDENGYMWLLGGSEEATLIEGLKTGQTKVSAARSRTLGLIETRVEVNWQQESRRPAGGIQETNRALVPDWQWHRRAVDNPLYPRNGNVTEFRIGGGSRSLLSDHNFLRSYARQQAWWPVGERDVVSLRGEVGVTAAASRLGIPQEYLFRAGGSQSVRGYAYQSLGIHEGMAVVGGRALATGSAEYTHWFSRDWGSALFADTGGVADSLNALHLSTGYGSGVRWRSPVGPLALDLAWGRQSHALHLHFSLAAVF